MEDNRKVVQPFLAKKGWKKFKFQPTALQCGEHQTLEDHQVSHPHQ
ncbi:MAG: hypothetical protein V4694_02650 [Pseudomonadota bacterium]